VKRLASRYPMPDIGRISGAAENAVRGKLRATLPGSPDLRPHVGVVRGGVCPVDHPRHSRGRGRCWSGGRLASSATPSARALALVEAPHTTVLSSSRTRSRP